MSKANLSREEMDAQQASQLPDKEAMSLLDVNADIDLTLDLAAPIDAAVAANANVAAPIDAAAAANALSPDSIASAGADQDSAVVQHLDGVAEAVSNQTATIDQGDAV